MSMRVEPGCEPSWGFCCRCLLVPPIAHRQLLFSRRIDCITPGIDQAVSRAIALTSKQFSKTFSEQFLVRSADSVPAIVNLRLSVDCRKRQSPLAGQTHWGNPTMI